MKISNLLIQLLFVLLITKAVSQGCIEGTNNCAKCAADNITCSTCSPGYYLNGT